MSKYDSVTITVGRVERLEAQAEAARATLAALEDDRNALQCLHNYLTRHADQLPPFSLSTLEVRIEKTDAAIAQAHAAGIAVEG